MEEVEGYKEFLPSILPTSLQKFNGEPVPEDLRAQIIEKR